MFYNRELKEWNNEKGYLFARSCAALEVTILRKGDTVYIYSEAEYHPSTTLQAIINAGMIPGIAINPGTSVETVMEMPGDYPPFRKEEAL